MIEKIDSISSSKIKGQDTYHSFMFSFNQIWVLAVKNIQLYFNKGPILMFGLLFPFFVMITWIIGRDISDTRLFIGITTMVIFFTSSAISPVIIPWENREKGLERQFSAPTNLTIIIWGIVLASSLYSLIISGIVITILAFITNITFNTPINILGFILSSIIFSFLASFFGVLISATPTDLVSVVNTISNIIKYPLLFISGIFLPLSQLSPIYAIIAWFSPLTPFVDNIALCIGENSFLPLLANLGILFTWCISLYYLSSICHRITFGKRFSQ